MHYNQLLNNNLSPQLKSVLHVKDLQKHMQMHYNKQKEKQRFVDYSELPLFNVLLNSQAVLRALTNFRVSPPQKLILLQKPSRHTWYSKLAMHTFHYREETVKP